jgi:hypothetical protein
VNTTSTDASLATSFSGTTLGHGVLSSTGVSNRRASMGRDISRLANSLYDVRARDLNASLGRWIERDPLAYVDGVSLYEDSISSPLVHQDWDGREIGCGQSKSGGPDTVVTIGEGDTPEEAQTNGMSLATVIIYIGYRPEYTCAICELGGGLREVCHRSINIDNTPRCSCQAATIDPHGSGHGPFYIKWTANCRCFGVKWTASCASCVTIPDPLQV